MVAAVDTNIVVRFLTQDDEQQYQKSLKLFQEQDITRYNKIYLSQIQSSLKRSGYYVFLIISSPMKFVRH
jgi:hypothetical protein